MQDAHVICLQLLSLVFLPIQKRQVHYRVEEIFLSATRLTDTVQITDRNYISISDDLHKFNPGSKNFSAAVQDFESLPGDRFVVKLLSEVHAWQKTATL